ncbi:MAG: hypothetical protein H6719_38500, partial [Sandaracinaceae bacterium]|nr:hypothetical protein [Sandaracinaceae bacterium]
VEVPGGVVRALHPAMGFPAALLLEDVRLEPGARHTVPATCAERAVYVLSGAIEVGGETAHAQQTALLEPGDATITATSAARVLAFGGDPVGPRYQWWNYLHSSLARIEEAREAWRAGTVPRPPGDTESFTPAPDDGGRPLVRLNG